MASHKRVKIYLSLIAMLLCSCATQPSLQDGEERIAHGKWEEGLAIFQQLNQREPRNPNYRAALLKAREHLLQQRLESGDNLLALGKADEAIQQYQLAKELDTINDRATDGLQAATTYKRHHRLIDDVHTALASHDTNTALFKLQTILTENPKHSTAQALHASLTRDSVEQLVAPNLSAAFQKPVTLDFKDAALRQIFDVLARVSGLNFIFDKEVRSDQKATLFLKNSTLESALHYLLLTNQLEQQTLNENTVLIYPATPAKQKDYQELVIKTFYLANADAKAIANSFKTLIKSRDVVVDEKLNLVILRDTPDAIRAAEKLVALQDAAEPEVMLEVEILEVKRTRLAELGIRWPDTLSLTALPSATGTPLTIRDLQQISSANTGISPTTATLRARKESTLTNILANPRIRARNHEKAKILIGERVPNITTTSTATGFVAESVTYVDVGLKLEVEPNIYLDNDVAIKIALEVSNIVNQIQTKSGSIAYQIGTRTASTVLRLKNGENQILAGLINDEDRRNSNKVPIFGDIPLLGRLFGTSTNNNEKTEIVLSITPRLVRNIQRPSALLTEFSSGTESSFKLRPRPTAVIKAPPTNDLKKSPEQRVQLSWRGATAVKAGELFSVDLILAPDQSLHSLPFTLSYDPKFLEVTQVIEGDLMKQPTSTGVFASKIDPAGQVLITTRNTGTAGSEASSQTGVLVSLKLRALAATENTRIEISKASATGMHGDIFSITDVSGYAVSVLP